MLKRSTVVFIVLALGCGGESQGVLGEAQDALDGSSSSRQLTNPGHDLSQSVDPVGTVIQTETVVSTDLEATVSLPKRKDQVFSAETTSRDLHKTRVTRLTPSGQLAEIRVKVIESTEETVLHIPGNKSKESTEGALHGTAFSGHVEDRRWRFELEQGDPSPEVQAALSQFVAVYDSPSIPTWKIDVGESWSLSPQDVARQFASFDGTLNGTMDLTLVQLTEFEGHPVGEVSTAAKLSGTDETGLTVTLDLQGSMMQSLEGQGTLHWLATGPILLEGPIKEDGSQLTLVGTVQLETTVTR